MQGEVVTVFLVFFSSHVFLVMFHEKNLRFVHITIAKIKFCSKVTASDPDFWIGGRRDLDLDTLTQLFLFKVKITIENTLLYNRTM